MNATGVQQFLQRVGQRQSAVTLARQGRRFLLLALGVYAVALLVSRFFGVITNWFTPLSLAVFAAAAFVLAGIFHRRPDSSAAARLADAHLRTPDLFLTASLIGNSLGAYQEIVLNDAEQRAAKARPQNVVPFRWQRDAFKLCAVLAAVTLAVFFLPQFDPFQLNQKLKQLAAQREQVRAISKATEARAALLEQKRAGESADVVKQAVAALEKTFQAAKPQDKVGTLNKLNEQQKLFGQLWKKTSEEKLKNGLNLPPSTQNFGLNDPAKAEQLRNDLQKGDVSSAKKELSDLMQKAQELAKTENPVEREKLKQEIMDRMQSLKDTLNQQANSQAVDSAMQRAMEQLAMANLPGLSGESLKGMNDSLKLTQEELDQLAKAMSDLKNLEDALKALQMAKALHSLKPLDGKEFEGFGDLAAYCKYCQGQCQSLCVVPGMGLNAGLGMGPRPYGDENSKTDFHPEKSISQLQPGKMLMEWKTREVSESGPAREEYLQAVQNVRQAASEAVVSEQVPPGYQAAIKNYFDTLHHDAPAKP
jgi:hypothetical protein